MPIVLLFLNENGFGETEMFILHAVYSVVIALVEVPSGYVADNWGRKPSLILGALLGFIGFSCYAYSSSFYWFLLAEVVLGIGQAFISGADSAMIYDSLLALKKKNLYLKIEGKITAAGNFAEGVAGITVSMLAFAIYRNYYYMQSVLALIAFIAALFLVEPKIHLSEVYKKNVWSIIKYTFRENARLRHIILFSSLIGLASLSMAWFAQVILKSIQVSEENWGYAWAVLQFLVGFGSMSTYFFYKKFSKKFMLVLMFVVFGGGFLIAGIQLNLIAIIVLIVFYFIRGTAHPILKNYINEECTSDMRATVMSMRSLLIRLAFFAVAPWMGYLSENISASTALLCTGAVVVLPGFVFLWLTIRDINKPGYNSSSSSS